VDALGGEYVLADQLAERAQHDGGGADMIGQGRDVEVNAFAGIGFALPVQRLVLAVLGVKDHRQQTRPDMAARNDVERRRRLGDLLAGAAGELLTDGLDHLPLPRHDLQGLRDGLAELGELAATTRARLRCRNHYPLARQMRWKGCPHRLSTGERVHRRASRCRGDFVLCRACRCFLELQFQLVEQLAAALGGLPVLLAPQLGDQQLQVCHHRLGTGGARLGLLPRAALGSQRCRQRGDFCGEDLGRGRHGPDCLTVPKPGRHSTIG
jgi:hypothetical protein